MGSLSKLFVEVLRLCRQAGLVRLGHVALDGTNASRHKAMSYGRMREESARLDREIADILGSAGRLDDEEDSRFGKEARGDDLPEGLRFRSTRLAKIRQAMSELEAEAPAAAEGDASPGVDSSDDDPRPTGRGRPKKRHSGLPEDRVQRNFTDHESRIMKSADRSYIQGYNAQAAVDSEYQVVVATLVTNQAADAVHVEAVVERIADNAGKLPDEMSLALATTLRRTWSIWSRRR